MEKKDCIIFDTDMDTDCDDAGAFAMLLEAHHSGKIEFTGVIADSVNKYAAPCCDMIAQYYKLNLPIGTIYADNYMDTEKNITRFADYRKHSENCLANGRSYNCIFAKEINKRDIDYPSAASIYRKLLSKAEDNSVTVLCVGMLTAVAEALCSKADNISPLSGVDLFKQKVKHVITMGNPNKTNDFNWGKDAYATEQVFSLCPVPIYISPEGTDVITGENLSAVLKCEHPLRRAYEIWLGKENCGRSSWDLIATLYAIDPKSPYLVCNDYGNYGYDTNKKQLYPNERNVQCKIIHLNCGTDTMEKLLNEYMLGNFNYI